MILKFQNRKIIFSVRKKITPTKKSLKIDRTPNLDTPRYRVYCLTPPELGDTVPKSNLNYFSYLVTATRWTFKEEHLILLPEGPIVWWFKIFMCVCLSVRPHDTKAIDTLLCHFELSWGPRKSIFRL